MVKNIEKILIGLIVGICLSICSVMFFLWVGWGGLEELRAPPPSEPLIKTAEIDFGIQYAVNGEIMEINDTIICEYNGYSYKPSLQKKTRNWSKSFKSDDTAVHLVLHEWVETYGIETYAIVVSMHPASYFMSDPDYTQNHEQGEYPFTIYVYNVLKGYYITDEKQIEKLLDICEFEITDWTCDPPIVNQFK